MRMVAKSPGTTAIALLTIGIATGANATVFGFVSALLLRPAPGVADPGSLVAIYTSDYSSGPYGTSSYPDYLSLKSDIPAFAHVAAQQDDSAGVVQVANQVERVPVASVTGEYFALLGVRPALGRLLTPADTDPTAPPVVVIGHTFWTRVLGANPGDRRRAAHRQRQAVHDRRRPCGGIRRARISACRFRCGSLSCHQRVRRARGETDRWRSWRGSPEARPSARRRRKSRRSPRALRRHIPTRTVERSRHRPSRGR